VHGKCHAFLHLCANTGLVGLYPITHHAQTATTGNITGTVRDPQGAAAPHADVTITDEKTGTARTVNATEDGFYNATSLPALTYSVSTAPSGFKKTVSTGVELHVNENKTVNSISR